MALTVAALAVACKAQEDAFYARIYPCDAKAGDEACGTTRSGKKMTCFAGSQLGGDDFCTEACDPRQPARDSRFTCLTSGALLQVCQPNGSAGHPTPGCPAGLECYRTDLLGDQGVCIKMPVCSQDSDCADKERPACAATIVREIQGTIPSMADHLECVQRMCATGRSPCPSGQSCLINFYPSGNSLRDLCVPNCVGDRQCPPNYACAVTPASSGDPSVCLPGIPGVRCTNNQDCVVGNCLDTGAGFSECGIPLPCTSNAQCASLNRITATFVCVEGVPGAGKQCVLLQSFAGANCIDPSDCPVELDCFHYSPYTVDQGFGECRVPCDENRRCPVRGGIPHVCLDGGRGGCYPTGFGLPCDSSADCLPEFSCELVSPDERSLVKDPSICTTACTTDQDCADNVPVTFSFCKEGFCRIDGQGGAPCERDQQCSSHFCSFDLSGKGQCAN